MPITTRAAGLFLALSLAGAPLAAQPPAQPQRFEFLGDVALVMTSGNTSVTTNRADERIIYRHGWRWTHTQNFGVTYGRTDEDVVAENYRAGLKTDFAFSPVFGSYGQATFFRDRFSGIAARYALSAGLSALAVNNESDKLTLEGGVVHTDERNVAGVIGKSFAARAQGVLKHNFAPTTYIEQTLEFLPNLREGEDLRINSLTALVAPISAHIGLKASYRIAYDGLPQAGFVETNTEFTTGLQVTF
jgi:putative salt-induced outer membrane protein